MRFPLLEKLRRHVLLLILEVLEGEQPTALGRLEYIPGVGVNRTRAAGIYPQRGPTAAGMTTAGGFRFDLRSRPIGALFRRLRHCDILNKSTYTQHFYTYYNFILRVLLCQ